MRTDLVTSISLLTFLSNPSVASGLPHPRPAPRTFFVDPSGDDSNDGMSVAHAWKSLARVSSEKFLAGDTIWLAAGQSFQGALVVNPASKGTVERPIVIGSRGQPATIVSPDETAITVSSAGIHLQNLKLMGNATKKKESHRGVLLIAKGPDRLTGDRLDKLEIRGFGGDGLSIQATPKNANGFEGLQVIEVTSMDNYGAGIISSDDFGWRGLPGAHRHILISDCVAANNRGGSGIVLSGIKGGIVEYCQATANVGPGGGVGMWAWAAQNLTFRYCISTGTRTGGGDGGGFDLDGATEDCLVDHCLSYNNAGPGYMHCDYPTAPFTRRNVIRNSVSIDDGAKEQGDSSGFGFVTWGSGLDDCVLSKNLALMTRPDEKNRDFGALFVSFIKGSQGPKDVSHVRGCKVEDNIVDIAGTGVAFVRSDLEKNTPENVIYIDNRFCSKVAPPFIDGTKSVGKFADLMDWLSAIGQGKELNQRTKGLDVSNVLSIYQNLRPRDLPRLFGLTNRLW